MAIHLYSPDDGNKRLNDWNSLFILMRLLRPPDIHPVLTWVSVILRTPTRQHGALTIDSQVFFMIVNFDVKFTHC